MRFLELRIPPPIVGLLIAASMWAIAKYPPIVQMPDFVRLLLAGTLAVTGAAVALAGVVSFHRAKTTVNPLKPEKSASLVSTGVYSVTRNPMYLGMALVLVAWAAYLASVWSLAGPLVFALYLTRYQIIPEERVLDGLFGEPFADYKKRVRRWI
jgi:protein-S-isoprenylcysteine O-methyltransferase Ste14